MLQLLLHNTGLLPGRVTYVIGTYTN